MCTTHEELKELINKFLLSYLKVDTRTYLTILYHQNRLSHCINLKFNINNYYQFILMCRVIYLRIALSKTLLR